MKGMRLFIALWALLPVAIMVVDGQTDASATSKGVVTVMYYGAKGDSAWKGATQGLKEANQQGEFLGQSFKLERAADVQALKKAHPVAVIAATDASGLHQLADALPGVAVLNVALDDDDLRAQCSANLLHVLPSQAMKRDAEAQWRRKNPDSRAVAQAWHHTAEKYSATQLNDRFEKTYHKAMDDTAWAGWAAMKMLGDTVIRVQSADPAAVLDYLKTQLKFDGQKGIEMNFRPNGQLRQPLMLVEGDKLMGEAPVKGVARGVEDLDSLGNVECKK
ncbi:MAG TPA: ABC transporter substrate-binding protein [Gammaproteobacteria bacterium]|nr:ABC transporter substrate-binding protein [Gammaproteobacteria bacterium]